MKKKDAPFQPDENRVSAWVDEHLPMLYGYALQRVRHPDIAEELVQETFLAALKNQEQFAQRSSESTWLVGILRHKILDHFRKRSDVTASSLESEDASISFFDAAGHWDRKPNAWSDDPAVLLENQEFWAVFKQCLGHLPEPLARAFVLREMEQCQSATVCQTLSISESNLWIRLHRARLRLRECLDHNWFTSGA